MSKTAVVTGAGTGVGRATAIALAKAGWKVALLGRRENVLQETVKLSGAAATNFLVQPCDVGDAAAVKKAAGNIVEKFGVVEVLVNAAGTNIPKRGLDVLTLENYRALVDTNLTGAFICVQAFLPAMRQQKSGTIVNIVSDAGKQASPKSGAAYVVSKFGMSGLTQSINAEERGNGIRACAIFPGDIDTPILDLRPAPPPAEARAKMLKSEDIADCVLLAVNLPSRAIVEELLIRPR